MFIKVAKALIASTLIVLLVIGLCLIAILYAFWITPIVFSIFGEGILGFTMSMGALLFPVIFLGAFAINMDET